MTEPAPRKPRLRDATPGELARALFRRIRPYRPPKPSPAPRPRVKPTT